MKKQDEGASSVGVVVAKLLQLRAHFAANLSVLGQLYVAKFEACLKRYERFCSQNFVDELESKQNFEKQAENQVSSSTIMIQG